jgi:hypothetical protein
MILQPSITPDIFYTNASLSDHLVCNHSLLGNSPRFRLQNVPRQQDNAPMILQHSATLGICGTIASLPDQIQVRLFLIYNHRFRHWNAVLLRDKHLLILQNSAAPDTYYTNAINFASL